MAPQRPITRSVLVLRATLWDMVDIHSNTYRTDPRLQKMTNLSVMYDLLAFVFIKASDITSNLNGWDVDGRCHDNVIPIVEKKRMLLHWYCCVVLICTDLVVAISIWETLDKHDVCRAKVNILDVLLQRREVSLEERWRLSARLLFKKKTSENESYWNMNCSATWTL